MAYIDDDVERVAIESGSQMCDFKIRSRCVKLERATLPLGLCRNQGFVRLTRPYTDLQEAMLDSTRHNSIAMTPRLRN